MFCGATEEVFKGEPSVENGDVPSLHAQPEPAGDQVRANMASACNELPTVRLGNTAELFPLTTPAEIRNIRDNVSNVIRLVLCWCQYRWIVHVCS